jgi:hypothetical protein
MFNQWGFFFIPPPFSKRNSVTSRINIGQNAFFDA